MAERFSTGFVNAVNVTGSVKTVMDYGVIGLFGGGTMPATADAAEVGTLLCLITLASGAFTGGVTTNGLRMGTSTAGVLSKDSGQTWSGVGLAAASTGTLATHFRWYDNSYTTGVDTTSARVDGQVGTTSSYELWAVNPVIAEGITCPVTSFTFTFPMS